MEIIILWIGTIIASFGMEMANELRMFKDAADSGYRIDINRMSELSKQVNPEASNAILKSLLAECKSHHRVQTAHGLPVHVTRHFSCP